MLRKIRTILAILTFAAITLLLLDFTGTLHGWLGWMAKIQFLPAVLALNFVVVAVLVVMTLVLGRIYCSVVCPLGVMQDVISWIHGKTKKNRFTYSKEKRWLRYGVLVVFIAAMVLGVFALTAKAMFPDIPLKKLLRPRHFLWLLGGVGLLAVADIVMPYYWEDWATLGKILRLAGTAALVGLGALALRRIGKRFVPAPAPEETPEQPPLTVEQQAMALADSVCPRPVYKV